MGTSIEILTEIASAADLENGQKPDIAGLWEAVDHAQVMAMDLRLTDEQREAYSVLAIELRDDALALAKVIFSQSLDKVIAVNQKIKEVNASAKKSLTDIERTAKTIKTMGELAHQLTELIGLIKP